MSTTPLIPLSSPAYLSNCEWIQAHLDQLVREYPDQGVAVDEGRVLAAGPDLARVRASARQISSSADVAYEFVAGVTMVF